MKAGNLLIPLSVFKRIVEKGGGEGEEEKRQRRRKQEIDNKKGKKVYNSECNTLMFSGIYHHRECVFLNRTLKCLQILIECAMRKTSELTILLSHITVSKSVFCSIIIG